MDPYKARKMAKLVAIIIVIAMVVTSFSFILFLPSMFGMQGSVVYAETNEDGKSLNQQVAELEQYLNYIQKYYKDDITYEKLINGAYNGIMEALEDPYSVYYKDQKEEESFVESVTGEFSGIGLSLESYFGQCRVVAPIVDTPAERAGVKSGDIVTKVDNVDVTTKTLDEAVSLMRGEAGTKVNLTINRNGQVLVFSMIREAIKNASVNYKMIDNEIGYIQITSFDNDTNTEFRKARIALVNKGAESFIVDVRNNPGGLINTATDIANQLMPKGPITHFEQKGEIIETLSADGNASYKMPTILLVNEGSASASEILAGALQDSKTATLVGATTYGKGVAQQVVTFPSGANMKLSMYYFLTPNKNKIDHIGIIPDYTVKNTTNLNLEEIANKYMSFAPMSEKVKPKSGDTGLNVYGAQQRLELIGYDVKINGTMDTKTVAAVSKLQKESGLSPYGVLDYTTMNTLDKKVKDFVTGSNDKDFQLEKAIELLK